MISNDRDEGTWFDSLEDWGYDSAPEFFEALDNTDMKRFSVSVFYRFGNAIKAAADCGHIQDREEVFRRLSECKGYLDHYRSSPVSTPQAAVEAGEAVKTINASIHGLAEQQALEVIGLDRVNASLETFSSAFKVEARSLDTYRVMPVGIYDTTKLIDHAEKAFSKEVLNDLDELTKTDINQAGRCLAMQLWTACGFHALRAVECMARRYQKCVLGKEPEGREATLGVVVGNLEPCLPKDKTKVPKEDQDLELIVSLMRRMNKMYRCPIMHPELILSEDQAKQVFDVAVILISAIVLDMSDRNLLGDLFRHSKPNP